MEIDLNINNKQKHWILVIIDKCKNVIVSIFSFIWRCIMGIGRFIKKRWRLIIGVFCLFGIIMGVVAACGYYIYDYIPEKKLDSAIEDITAKINSTNDSIKTEYSRNVLDRDYEWGYDDVDDYRIYIRLEDYRESSFKFIESKAYTGDAECQYLLGQMYYWGEKSFFYVQADYGKAAYWWNEAASQNYIKAYNNIGMAYLQGWGVNKDIEKAVEFLKKGAEAGEAYAQRNYGDLFLEGVKIMTGSHKEVRSTKNHYFGSSDDVISEQYDYQTNSTVTRYYEEVDDYKILVPKDIEQAKNWWKKSAVQGNEEAKERLQKIYN